MRPEVIDLDGGERAPSRAGAVRVVSVGLVFAALVGYAAVSSPALRGPFATPHPSAVAALRVFDLAQDKRASRIVPIRCGAVDPLFPTVVIVGGQPANVAAPLAWTTSPPCWASSGTLPFDRFAR